MKQFIILISFSALLTCPEALTAQDSLAPVRDFITISNNYQRNEMHLKLTVESNANIPAFDTDTSTINAEFFVTDHDSYSRFEKFEQLVNDSQALLISLDQQKMILYTNAEAVIQQAKLTKGFTVSDTSINAMADLFNGTQGSAGVYNEIILTAKELLTGTSYPRQELKLTYHPDSKIPVRVNTLVRTLVSEASVISDSGAPIPGNVTRVTIDNQSFIIKEQWVTYHYHAVEYDNVQIPRIISSCLSRNSSGELIPSGTYANFVLTAY